MIPQLAVHFIVHNDFSHIEAALDSLYQTTTISSQIHLTINSGQSVNTERIRSQYPQVQIIINTHSISFAANHNNLMRRVNAPFVALINDDVIFHPQSLDTLVRYLDMHQDVGLVGPLVENPDGSMQLSTFSDPSLLRMLFHMSGLNKFTKHGGVFRRVLQRLQIARLIRVESLNSDLITRDVPVIVGVCMVARREAFLQAGMMDEYTQMYAEEMGWHWRLRQQGWRVVFVPSARVTHYNLAQDLSGWKLTEHRKGVLAYFLQYRPAWQAHIIRLAIILSHTLASFVTVPFNRDVARTHWQTVRMGMTWKITITDVSTASPLSH